MDEVDRRPEKSLDMVLIMSPSGGWISEVDVDLCCRVVSSVTSSVAMVVLVTMV